MRSWQEFESLADKNGFIPEGVYNDCACLFPVCPPQSPEVRRLESEIWGAYLSATKRRDKTCQMYQEMFRYEWYEGRKRRGFWGNIEKALRLIEPGDAPVISILSAGSGRDLLKVGLASGVFSSTAPEKIRGTYREIDKKYLRLAKPEAKIMLTEFDESNLSSLRHTVASLVEAGALTGEMTAIRKWDFRQTAPLATGTQDIIVFPLTGNYATIEEQPLILREIARCVKNGGHLIASAMTDQFDFLKARSPLGKLRLTLNTPLGMPVALDFAPWQSRWAKLAGEMNERGYWKNVSAATWMEFLKPAGMEEVKIYPGPSKLVPVEVLVARKI